MKRGAQVLAGLLDDFSSVEDALKTMDEAAGSSDREMGVIESSLEYKINRLKETWVGVAQTLIDRGTVGGVIDFLTSVSDGIGGIISNLGILKTAIIGIGAIFGSQMNLFGYNREEGRMSFGLLNGLQTSKGHKKDAGQLSALKDRLSTFQSQPLQAGWKEFIFNDLYGGIDGATEKTNQLFDSWVEGGKSAEDAVKDIDFELGELKKDAGGLVGALKNIGGSLLSMGLNALISMGASVIIQSVTDAIDKAVVTKKELENAAREFNTSYSEFVKDQNEFGKRVSSYSDEFEELSKGVNDFGENISLTDEQFQRYREISDDVAQNMPELIQLWNDQGDAVIGLRDNVNSLTEAYRENQQTAAYNLYHKVDEDDDLNYASATLQEAKTKHETRTFYTPTATTSNGPAIRENGTFSVAEQHEELKKLAAADANLLKEMLASGNAYEKEILQKIGATEQAINDDINNIHNQLQNELNNFESDLRNSAHNVSEVASLYAQSLDQYWQQEYDSTRKYINLILGNLDYDFINANDLFDEENLQQFVTSVITQLQGMSNTDLEQIELRFNLSTMFNNGEITVGEYLNKLAELEQWIGGLPEETQKVIRLLFDIDGDDKIQERRNRVVAMMQGKGVGANDTLNFVDKLNTKQLSLWEDLLNGGDIPDDLLSQGEAEWIAYLNLLQRDADNNKIEIQSTINAVDSINEAKEAITSLEELYEQTVKNRLNLGKDKKYVDENGSVTKELNDNNMAVGYADSELINKVESAFGGIAAEDSKVSEALRVFEKTLVEFPGDAEKAQGAIDNLITAYIDQTDVIQNLKKENAEWSIKQLEAMGVTNAEEVVMSRLNTTTKKLMSSISNLGKSYEKLIKSQKGSDQYTQSLDEMVGSLNEAFSVDTGDGKTWTPDFDADFVTENLELIQRLIQDDKDAIIEMQHIAAKKLVMGIEINAPDEGAMAGIEGQINSWIDNFDINDVDVHGTFDNSAIVTGLNAMVQQGLLYRDDMNKILASVGVVPQIEYQKADIQSIIKDKWHLSGTAAVQAQRGMEMSQEYKLTGQVSVPKITYKPAGAVAHYSPPSNTGQTQTSGGSGGSGGGGGSNSEPNKPKEEAAETFDWIEVAIQRLEEEQARLDKVVNNSYKGWSTRNKKLTEELKVIGQEIDANKLAADAYAKAAGKIKVNDGKGLNDDDYGENDQLVKAADQKALDEARRIWGTGEYQKKVQNGLLSSEGLEKITNKYLKQTIQEYQEAWNKYVAANDKVQDKEIEYADKLKQRFDMIKTQYEQITTLIQDRADVINAKIERTQAKGFFVSNDYYKQLIANENKQLAQMEQEREKLIKARNDGMVKNGWTMASEEYRNMTHDINALTTSIEQAKNQTIEWQNTMRQNNWDKFDWMEQRIERIKTEAQGLIDLMSNDKLYEDDGRLTDKGMASLGMIAVQYQTNERQIAHYRSELKKLSDQIKGDPSNKDLIARYDELADKTNELVSSNEQLKDSWKSMVEEGIQTHLSNLDKIIEKYQEISDAEKEMYDYQKNISKQVKNINELERMLTIYSGDDSEEARKNRQQLQTQLEDAKEALQETEWDKAISESKKLVSQMREDYEEFLNKRLDDIDALMEYGIGEAKVNTKDIVDTIEAEAVKTGFVLTPEIQSVLDHSEETNLPSGTNEAVKDIKDYVKKMADREDMDSYENFKTEADKRNEKRWDAVESATARIKENIQARDNAKTAAGAQKKQESIDKSEQTATETLDALEKSYRTQLEKLYVLQKKGQNVDYEIRQTEKLLKDVENARSEIFNLLHAGSGILRAYSGYAKGSRRIPHDQLAWTQEEGQELIFRASDGAMLTPLGAGDMVFTNDMTKKLFDFASGNLPVLTMPNVPTNSGNNINNNNAISITLPNVQNYDQFKAEMKKDTRLQTWMQEITLGQAIGKNTLRRNSL